MVVVVVAVVVDMGCIHNMVACDVDSMVGSDQLSRSDLPPLLIYLVYSGVYLPSH